MGKLELNKKKKKDALFNTAFELFTTKGLTKTTISDIVNQAGVAKGTFYLYFKDKYDIRNKLVSHKTGELFFRAHEALQDAHITQFDEQVHFIVDFILTALDQDRTLLLFISKNLAWGVFKGAFEEKMPDDEYNFYQSYLDMLAQNGLHYKNPELLLFTIIELVGIVYDGREEVHRMDGGYVVGDLVDTCVVAGIKTHQKAGIINVSFMTAYRKMA